MKIMENNNYLVTPDSHQGVPHITPERLATLHRGTIANNDYVLSTGRKFETEIISNNVIRVYDGALIQGGIRGEIEHGDYKDVQISNGIIGMKRHSLIVCRWFVDAEDGRKTHQKIIAVDGIATDKEPIDPEVNTNLIEDGAQVHDTVLYRVVKDGLDIVKVEALFKILMNAEELMEMQKEINSKLEDSKNPNNYAWVALQSRTLPGSKETYLLAESLTSEVGFASATKGSAAIYIKKPGRYLIMARINIETSSPNVILKLNRRQSTESDYVTYREVGMQKNAGEYSQMTLLATYDYNTAFGLAVKNNSSSDCKVGSSAICIIPI